MEEMFCFQCQQTAHNSGCEGRAGVCGKKSDTANYQDELTGALIGLSRAVRKKLALNPDASFEHADELILKGLFTTITNVNFFNDTIIELIREVNVEKDRIYPDIMNYDVHHIWEDQEDIRSLKSLMLFGLRGMAAYAYHCLLYTSLQRFINHSRNLKFFHFKPMINSIISNDTGINLVGFGFSQTFVTITFHKIRINYRNKKSFFL